MQITPRSVAQLAQLALTLEPILDKKDCTTRFIDLPDKPLADFLIAAINIGGVVEDYAQSVLAGGNKQIFSHFYDAIQASNHFKANKYINVGLLEALLITIKVRLTYSSLAEALDGYVGVLKSSPRSDFEDYTKAFELAWSTSKNPQKQAVLSFMREHVADNTPSFYEWHALKQRYNSDKTSADYQVTEQYNQGFPIIKEFVTNIRVDLGLLKSIERAYDELHSNFPEIKIGILADLSAAAMYLYLSYQDDSSYIIR